MPLRCVYTDLDGTLFGRGGSLFHDAEGEFTMLPARALEACNRAGVEVVIKSGRREAQVNEDAKLMGQSSYIYEAGCAVVIDGEKTVLTGDLRPSGEMSLADEMSEAGATDLLLERYRGRLEWHSPWHTERFHSHLFRGEVEVGDANDALKAAGHHDLRLIDNGAIGYRMEGIEQPHAYHLMPAASSKSAAVVFHMRARGYQPEECIAIGDSLEDLEVAEVVGRFFVPVNGPERDPALREAIAGRPNVTVTEGSMGDGVYEAVVSTLAAGGGAGH